MKKVLGVENNTLINGLILPVDSYLSDKFEFKVGFLWGPSP